MLINQDIKNLVSGISQQPPILRHPEQLEEQLNGYSSEAGGLQKRPPTLFEAKLGRKLNTENKPLIHFINRDNYEKYIVMFTGSDIEVYDLQGNKKTVNFKGNSKSYIFTQDPRFKIKTVTIADYTFVANTTQITSMSQEVSKNTWETQGFLVNIKSGQYGRTYKIVINGEEVASHTTPDGSDKSHTSQIATDYIVEKLAEALTSKAFNVEKGSSWLYITKTKTVDATGSQTIQCPSTTVPQQIDRFNGLKSSYWYVEDKYGSIGYANVYPIITQTDANTIVIKCMYEHLEDEYGNNTAFINEINRCKSDYWKVTQTAINEKINGYYYDTKYTIVYTTNASSTTATKVITSIDSGAVYDGYNNQAAFGILHSVQKFSNLPTTAPNGFTVKVAGEQGSLSDDYYVSFDATDNIWRETLRPGLTNKINKSTMPHVLVREADGTFTFKEADWAERTTGDEDSNPVPTFIGQSINEIFYFRNRLGFLSGENVILTCSADFFNFWMTSAIEVQDTDPIDLAVSDNKISVLSHAVPFDAELILFSEDAQFALQADNVLSPKDAYITPPLTHFGCSLKATPVNAGRNIYFPAERAKYTTMREYFTASDNTDSKDAQDITSHVPSYIPNGVYKLVPSTIENILLCLTEGEENAVYVYKYLFIDGQRQQAAWSKWDFKDKVYGGAFLDSFFYIVVERNGWLCLEKMSFTFNTTDLIGEPYRVLLDRKIIYTIPQSTTVLESTKVNIAELYGDTFDKNKQYSIVIEDGTYLNVGDDGFVTIEGDYSGKTLTAGMNYLFRITLSTIMVKQNNDGSTAALTDGRLQLRQCWLNYADSGYFKVIVETLDKENYVYENTSRILGTLSNILGKMPFTTGSFKFPVQSLNTNCSIKVETNEPLPISLIGAGWTGNYQRRTRLF